jgi:putative oxidoreductase
MRIAAAIARYLLGVIFVFFGSNLLLNFLHSPAVPPGPLANFVGALVVTHYIYFVAFFQIFGGLLLLIDRWVPLGLTLLAPVIVNILLVHFLMAPSGIPMALLVTVLWLLTAYRVRSAFLPLLQWRVKD